MNDRHIVNIEHADNPIVGDVWHEMFNYICRVTDVTENKVTYVNIEYNDKGGYETNHVTIGREEFALKFRYNTDSNKTWADVVPNEWNTAKKYLEIIDEL